MSPVSFFRLAKSKNVDEGKIYVLMPTYNHVRFLQAAVEGVMSQVVDLPVSLIIRDDASTDGTRDLAINLASRFYGRIQLILNERNNFEAGHGLLPEMLRQIILPDGRFGDSLSFNPRRSERVGFIALCEGDDFWTDPTKLQRQLEIFRANKSTALVYHDVEFLIENGGSKEYAKSLRLHLDNFNVDQSKVRGRYFYNGHNVMTCSAMFRISAVDNRILQGYPPGLAEDWIVFSLISESHRPHFIPRRMATYRLHGDSFWSSKEENAREKAGLATKFFLDSIPRKGIFAK